jgi:hypothetical protein
MNFSTITRGTLPAGTPIDTLGGEAHIVDVSLTAYKVEVTVPREGSGNVPGSILWVSFDRVHGKPEPVTPLVTFG